MPNYPSIYLELQELWKRLRSSTTDVSSLDSRLTAVEQDIADGVPPSGPAGGVLRGTYPNPSALGSPVSTDVIVVQPYTNTDGNQYINIKAQNHDTQGNNLAILGGDGADEGGDASIYGGDGTQAGNACVDSGHGTGGTVYIGNHNAKNIEIATSNTEDQTVYINNVRSGGRTIIGASVDENSTITTINGTVVINNLALAAEEYNIVVKNNSTNYLSQISIADLNSQITVETDGVNIIGDGTDGDKISLNSNITASNILVTNNITIQGTASIAQLNTINQQSLQVGDKYITIMSGGTDHIGLDGAGILWGSGSTGPTVDENGSNAYVKFRSTGDQLEIYPGLKVSGSLSASAGITGSFSGSTATINQITASNFRAVGIPASSQTNVVVVDSNGVFGKTTLSGLGGVSGDFTGILTGTMPNALALKGIDQTTYSTIPLNANNRNILRIEVEDKTEAPDLHILGGSSTAGGNSGGDIGILGGDGANGSTEGTGGNVIIQGGDAGQPTTGSGTKRGGDIIILGGQGKNQAGLVGGKGGNVYIQGGAGNDPGGIYLDVNLPPLLNFDLDSEPVPSINIGTLLQSETNIKISGSIVPAVNGEYVLGYSGLGGSKRWYYIFSQNLDSTSITSNDINTTKLTSSNAQITQTLNTSQLTASNIQASNIYTNSIKSDNINFYNGSLNYYGTGSWTPSFTYLVDNGAPWTSYGKYIRIGNMVTAFGTAETSNNTNALDDGTYALQIAGLPFTSNWYQYIGGNLIGYKSSNDDKGGDIYPLIMLYLIPNKNGPNIVVNKDISTTYQKLLFTINYMVS